MKLKLPNVWETYGTIKAAVFETQKATKYQHSLSVECLYVDANCIGNVVQGMTDEAQSFLYVPIFQRVWRNLCPIHINGKHFFILSSRNKNTINVLELASHADKIKQDFKAKMTVDDMMANFLLYKWQYADHVISFEVKDCPTTIDPRALDMDDELDAHYGADAFRVLQTKNLSFMEDTTRRQLLMSMAIAGLLGMLCGGVMAFIGSLILVYYRQ